MKALTLNETCDLRNNRTPLKLVDMPEPVPGDKDILLKVSACAVCHTELDEIEGRIPPPVFPVVPGHQVIGRVVGSGRHAKRFKPGDRVGVAWIFSACGECRYCSTGNENLCSRFMATGRDADGGYAEFMTVQEDFAYPIPEFFSDALAAPLLCAGAIGYRSLRLTGLTDGQKLGLTGFGASGHLVLKMVKHRFPQTEIFVFARSKTEQEFALELGAAWSGDTCIRAPVGMDCIIDTTPAWTPVVEAMKNLSPGGRLIINAIRKEDADKDSLLALDYTDHLWMEREIKSVANVTRADVTAFLSLAAEMKLESEYQEYGLEDANIALLELKMRRIRGAKVLRID